MRFVFVVDLQDTHFQSQHIYRVEWQPGDKGFIEWYDSSGVM